MDVEGGEEAGRAGGVYDTAATEIDGRVGEERRGVGVGGGSRL